MSIEAEKYFPFDLVAETLTRWGLAIEWREDGIAWPWRGGQGRSEMTFYPLNVTTTDGFDIVGGVQCRHLIGGFYVDPISPLEAATWNLSVSTSAVLPHTEKEPAAIFCRASIFADDKEVVESLYAPIITTEAYMQPQLFAAIAENWTGKGAAFFGLADADSLPPFTADEFLEIRDICHSRGIDASASATGSTIEFAWDPDAISSTRSALTGDAVADWAQHRTSLCTISADETHPYLGRGLLATLRLPLTFSSDEELVGMVTSLNRFEVKGVDMPPFFGAWCIGPMRTVAFVSFIPNEIFMPGLARSQFQWMGHRAHRIPRSFEDIFAP